MLFIFWLRFIGNNKNKNDNIKRNNSKNIIVI